MCSLQNVFYEGEAVLRVRMVDFKVIITLILNVLSTECVLKRGGCAACKNG